jgi:uncharacterized protein YjbI with pentapeptide repeats
MSLSAFPQRRASTPPFSALAPSHREANDLEKADRPPARRARGAQRGGRAFALSGGPASADVTCPTVTGGTIGTVSPAPTPGVDWQGCNLAYADLGGADPANANLADTNLSWATLAGVTVTGTNLTGGTLAHMAGYALTGTPSSLPAHWLLRYHMLIGPSADLPDAPLTGANLVGVDLAGANLSGAHLASSNLTGANLSKVNLTTTKARPIVPSEASWLAASRHVRVTLTGQSIKAVVAYCAWKTAAKEFSRVVKIPKGIKT